MPLEATVLVLDNSEWMRNGDFTPSRLAAQGDAVNLIFGAKTQQNAENTVGLMTMAGAKGPEVLVTFTSDMGKILTATHGIRLDGTIHLANGIAVAQLALKHRQNKNQRQRVVVFVGSPIAEDEKALIKLAKKLKKNSVAVDVINFGEEEENRTKLQAFIENVNSNDNSHLLNVPKTGGLLSDVIVSSPIVAGEDGSAPMGMSAGDFEFGVDPNLDPELALALRISMEEEKARLGMSEGQEQAGGSGQGPDVMMGHGEDAELAKALAMSMGQDETMDTEEDEEAKAIALSMELERQAKAAAKPPSDAAKKPGPGSPSKKK